MAQFRFPQPNQSIYEEFAKIVGSDNISVNSLDRANYSRDLWPTAQVWMQGLEFPYPPSMVIWPKNAEEISKILIHAGLRKIQVVPYGAGSGVCGGAIPVGGGLILDMKKLDSIIDIDEKSLLVTVETGTIGENLERKLNDRGYTLGHFPGSMYCSTVGGWLAARSAGQYSSRYGKIEDIVVGIEAVLPTGEKIKTRVAPRSAAGPNFNQLFVGSEGLLAVITRAVLRIWPLPEAKRFLSYEFDSVDSGLTAIRRVMQAGLRPAMIRLYDEVDSAIIGRADGGGSIPTKLQKIIEELYSGKTEVARIATRLALSRPRSINALAALVGKKCLGMMIFEGTEELIDAEVGEAAKICADSGAEDSGEGPARRWLETRYDVAYKASPVFAAGAFADTLEISATWERLGNLYNAMRDEIGRHAFVMAHFSHAYPDGCSIYFTFVGTARDHIAREKKLARIYRRALNTCLHYGGSISHHHGVGFSKQAHLAEELGGAFSLFKAVKKSVDPYNILNPGKMGL